MMAVITPYAASVLQTMTRAQVLCAVVWGIITVENPSAPMQYMRKMPCRLEDVTQAKELKAALPVETRTAILLLEEHAPPEILWAYRSFATSRWVERNALCVAGVAVCMSLNVDLSCECAFTCFFCFVLHISDTLCKVSHLR
jgi:hypothetical protein